LGLFPVWLLCCKGKGSKDQNQWGKDDWNYGEKRLNGGKYKLKVQTQTQNKFQNSSLNSKQTWAKEENSWCFLFQVSDVLRPIRY